MAPTKPLNLNLNLDNDFPPTQTEAPTALPNDDDYCITCKYPLRNLQTWRCPECGHENSPEELAANKCYLDHTTDYVTKCLLTPPAILTAGILIVIMIQTMIFNQSRDFAVSTLLILFLIAQPFALVRAAARITQATLIKRKSPPKALSIRPVSAILVFLVHFAWLTFITLIFLTIVIGMLDG